MRELSAERQRTVLILAAACLAGCGTLTAPRKKRSDAWTEVVVANGGALDFSGGFMNATSPATNPSMPFLSYLRKQIDVPAQTFRIETSVAIVKPGASHAELLALYMDLGNGDRWTTSIAVGATGIPAFTEATHIGMSDESSDETVSSVTLGATPMRFVAIITMGANPRFELGVDGKIVVSRSISPKSGTPNAVVGITYTNATSWEIHHDDVIIDAR